MNRDEQFGGLPGPYEQMGGGPGMQSNQGAPPAAHAQGNSDHYGPPDDSDSDSPLFATDEFRVWYVASIASHASSAVLCTDYLCECPLF